MAMTPLQIAHASITRQLYAFSMGEGLYAINGKTYRHRVEYAKSGAKWNPKRKAWVGVPLDIVNKTGAFIRHKIRIAKHCHEEERDIYANHREVELGLVRMGCGMCDTSYRCGDDVKILKDYGEVKWQDGM